MANQISVNSGTGNQQITVTSTGNIQVTTSRSVIGTISNVPTANFANFAGNVTGANQPNITNIGTLANLSVTNTATIGNLIVTGNLAVGNLVANSANFANFAGVANIANSVAVANVVGIGNIATVNLDGNAGNILYGNGVFASTPVISNVANANFANFAGTAFNVSGSNVSGAVANATYANDAGNANTANSATVANSANSVAVANVSGIGNIATVNLDGNASNILYGNGVFATTPVISNVANANYANFSGTAFSVSGSNVSGAVANAIYADNAGNANLANLATFATTANAVAGANVSGTVANANYSAFANIAASANSVAVANVSGIGNIATVNLDGSSSNVLFGNGVFAPESTSIANANYANFAGTAFNVSGSNVSGEVANAAYANIAGVANSVAGANVSGEVSFAATANSVAGANVSGTVANATFAANAGNANVANTANSVAVANVSGIGNIATINLDGSSSNVLYGNGVFAPESTSIANANYANFAGDVVNSAQPNITSVGNLPYLQVSNSANSTGVIRQISSGNITFTTSAANTATFQITTQYHPNNSVGYPSERTIRSRGNVTNPTAVATGDRISSRTGHGFNGNTNPLSVAETFTIVGLNANANAVWTGGQWNFTTGNPSGNTANQESLTWQNQLIYTNSGSFQINPGTPANTSAGQSTQSILITNYGTSTTDLVTAGGVNQQKARGNRDGLLSVQPNDQVGRLNMWGYNGANYISARPASLFARVASSYVANATIIPLDMVIRTINSSNANVDTTFFANGAVTTSGNLTVGSGSGLISTNQISLANSTLPGLLQVTGDKTSASGINITDGQFVVQSNNSPLSPLFFNIADSNASIGSQINYRTRGTQASPLAVTAGDEVVKRTYNVYGDSGNTFASAGFETVSIASNDGAGNIGTNYVASFGQGTTGLANSSISYNVANTTFNGNLNVTGTISYNTRTFGEFTSNVTQTNSNVGNAVYMTLNNTEDANGVSIVSSSQITVARTGRYNIQFSAQIEKTDTGTDEVEIWLVKNGTPVANSATRLAQQGNNEKGVAAWNWLDNATTANTYYQIAWASTDANMQITAIDSANTLSGVAIPSVIVTVVPVGA
jgi:hypothetical protein